MESEESSSSVTVSDELEPDWSSMWSTSFESELDFEQSNSSSSDEMDSSPPAPRAKKFKRETDSETIGKPNEDKKNLSEGSFKDKVHAVLCKVDKQAAGEFAVSGKLNDAPLITISIKDAGNRKMFFPFYEEDAEGIIQCFEQSPYGKGSQTVVDTAVRNSWQLEPKGFEILNPEWDVYVKDVLLPRIGNEMVIKFSFAASLYKLLLYKTGSFFKPHRDSEKEDGMFATLVIQLPTKYQGGQLLVSHDGKTKTINFSSSDTVTKEFSTFYSAFYCDCQHEILPVTEGLRLCLIYNLISENNIIFLPQRNPFEKKLKDLLENWGSPGKIVYALKHKYSTHNISFANLKTTDRTIASMLKYLSEEYVPLDIYLAVFEKGSQGFGDAHERYGFSTYEAIDFDSADENSMRHYELQNLVSVTGEDLPMEKLTVKFEIEVIPENCFEDIEPYHKTQEQEPSGNEGVDCTKAYRSSAIVFWPKKYLLRTLKSSGVSNSKVMDIFQKGVKEFREKQTEELRKKVFDDAKALVYAKCRTNYYESDKKNYWERLFVSLIELQDLELIQALCDRSLDINPETLPITIKLCEQYGWKTFEKQLVSMFKKTRDRTDGVELLDSLTESQNMTEERKEIFRRVMSAIIEKYSQPPRFPTYCKESPSKTQNEDVQFIFRVAQKIDFNMIELLQSLLRKIILSELILPWIVGECKKYGWKFFMAEIGIMVAKSSEHIAADFLGLVIGKDTTVNIAEDKREICLKILSAILEEIKKGGLKSYQSRDPKKHEKLLYSLHASAVKINFNMVELLQTLFQNISVNVSMLPWIVNECKKHDWKSFKTEISIMVSKLSEFDATDFLALMIGRNALMNINEDKKEICHKILGGVLKKIKEESEKLFPSKGEQKNDERLLYSLCSSAVKIHFDIIKVLQSLLPRLCIENHTTFSWVIDQCNACGWKPFVKQFPVMFQKLSNISETSNLIHLLIGKNWVSINADRKQVCSRVLTAILDRIKGSSFTSNEAFENLLFSLCIAAHKIDFSMLEFMKSRPFTVAVPVLIKVTAYSINRRKMFEGQWVTIANHFIQEMRILIAKKNKAPSWKICVTKICSCEDCSDLHDFLKKNLQTQEFKMEKDRRRHMRDRVSCIPGILHETQSSGQGTRVLVVKKTTQSGLDNFAKGNQATELLSKLLAVVRN